MRVFILEDDPYRMACFRELFKGHDIDHADSCLQINHFRPPYNVVFLDHDLGGRQMDEYEDDGEAFAKLVVGRLGLAQVIIHSFNPEGAQRIQRVTGGLLAPFKSPWFKALVHLVLQGAK